MRKIVQISTATDPLLEVVVITALDNEGRVWILVNGKIWERLPPIPQDDSNAND